MKYIKRFVGMITLIVFVICFTLPIISLGTKKVEKWIEKHFGKFTDKMLDWADL